MFRFARYPVFQLIAYLAGDLRHLLYSRCHSFLIHCIPDVFLLFNDQTIIVYSNYISIAENNLTILGVVTLPSKHHFLCLLISNSRGKADAVSRLANQTFFTKCNHDVVLAWQLEVWFIISFVGV